MNLIGQRRRNEPRWFESASGRTGRFDAVATSSGKPVQVVGTRLAREGVAFVSGVALRDPELPLSFTIRRRTIPSRVRVLRHEPFREAARLVHRYYCSFTALDDADRDVVGRYVDGVPEPADEPAAHDTRTGLSTVAQTRIADQLVKMKRLANAAPGLAPLIRLEAEPPRTLEDGREVRCFAVHSRLRTADGVRSFVTRFRVFADDQIDVQP
ncbi:MAG TPA: hypothetical protein VGD01_17430 [Candidatus Elarobacter sp.]|jgi:hypothetical protein